MDQCHAIGKEFISILMEAFRIPFGVGPFEGALRGHTSPRIVLSTLNSLSLSHIANSVVFKSGKNI